MKQSKCLVALDLCTSARAQTGDPELIACDGFNDPTGTRVEILNGDSGRSGPRLWRNGFDGKGMRMALPRYEWVDDGMTDIDLAEYTRGFTQSSEYTFLESPDGSLMDTSNGSVSRHALPVGFTGITHLVFEVTESEGTSMTRTIGIRVLGE